MDEEAPEKTDARNRPFDYVLLFHTIFNLVKKEENIEFLPVPMVGRVTLEVTLQRLRVGTHQLFKRVPGRHRDSLREINLL